MEKTNKPNTDKNLILEYRVLLGDINERDEDDDYGLTPEEIKDIADRVWDYIYDAYSQFVSDACVSVVDERAPIQPVVKKTFGL